MARGVRVLNHHCHRIGAIIRLNLIGAKKSVRCPRCQKRVSVPRPAKPLWRATTQQEAVRAHGRAVQEFDRSLTRIKRIVTSLGTWRRRIDYYAREAAITDEQRQQRTQERAADRETRRRRRSERKVVT